MQLKKDELLEIVQSMKHQYLGDVKFSMVDSFSVVHNIAYLYLIEWARTEYFFDIGLPRDQSLFSHQMPLMTVNTQIDYFASLRFTDQYKILTKTKAIGKSSITLINATLNVNNELVNFAQSTLVYVNSHTGKSENFPDIAKLLISKYENLDF